MNKRDLKIENKIQNIVEVFKEIKMKNLEFCEIKEKLSKGKKEKDTKEEKIKSLLYSFSYI